MRVVAGRFGAQIAVVVLGVLIALWADEWVRSRADRYTETARLEALQLNVDTTLVALRAFDTDVQDAAQALRDLLTLEFGGPVDPDALTGLILRGLFAVPSLEAQLNVYDDLKNSGELALLKDPEVRQALSEMDARMQLIALAQIDLSSVQQLNVDPLLIRRLDLVPMVLALHRLEHSPRPEAVGPVLDFLGEREFRNLVVFKLDILLQISSGIDRLERALLRVRTAIASRLEVLPGGID